MAFGRIYKAPCGKTHRVVRNNFPPTLDAELGQTRDSDGVKSLRLPDEYAECKTCDQVKSEPCFGIAVGPVLMGVTQYRCPGWVLTRD